MKRTLSMVLALLLMLAALAGCANSTDTPQADAPDATTDAPDSADPLPDATADAEDPATDAPAPDDAAPEDGAQAPMGADVALPFAEPKTFSFWLNNMSLPTGYTDYNECEIFQEIEQRTNAHIEWTIPNMANAAEQFSLMLTSENYTDVFFSPFLTGGYDYSIEEEIIIDLSELVPIYAPHFYELLLTDEASRKDMFTDEGNLPGLNMINVSYEANFLGYFVRQDWLDAVGFTGPVETYDDWSEVLRRWKEDLGKTGTLYFDNTSGQSTSFMAGFDTGSSMLAFDGQVVFAPMEQNYRDYLAQMAAWYAEEYIDRDFTGRSGFFADFALFAGDEFGFFSYFYSGMDQLEAMAATPGYQLTAVDFPRREDGDMQRTKQAGNAANLLGGAKTCISTQCEEPEAVLQWFDYFYTEEGMRRAKGAAAIWDARWDPALSISMPQGLSLTAAESEDSATHLNDINTYVQEYTAKVIIGEEQLDSSWDQYVEHIQNMNVQVCIDAYQAAYDRYQTR